MLKTMSINNNLRSLAKSFSCAIHGLIVCIVGERNMRIHIVVAVYVLVFSTFYKLLHLEYCILLLAIALVIICEMLNTAMESIVDKISPGYTPLARIAKDIAAGAVFVSAIFAVIIGLILFLDMNVLAEILAFIFFHPVRIIALFISLILSILFIFKGFKYISPTDRILHRKKGDKKK